MFYQFPFPLSQNINPFLSLDSYFRVTGHFETNAPNDLTMALNTTKSNVHPICFTNTLCPKLLSTTINHFQIFIIFYFPIDHSYILSFKFPR